MTRFAIPNGFFARFIHASPRPTSPSDGVMTGPIAWIAVCVLSALSGCDGGLRTDYGPSKGILAKRSVNGFTTFREAFNQAGFSQRDLSRLTERARRASVVVWTPTHPTGIESDTSRWFERWLQIGDKTLIYVIPDSGSEADFYRAARPLASPEQRLEYRRKYAESLIAEHQWQLQRTALPSNGWFAVLPKVQRTVVEVADQAAAKEAGWKDDIASSEARRFEWVLEQDDADNSAQQGAVIWQPAGPGSPPWSAGNSISRTKTAVDFQPILRSDDGDTLLARVTSKKWGGSQILVVAGGSLLTNYGLTHPQNQRVADGLIESSIQTLIDGEVIDPEMRLIADGSEPQVAFSTANGVLTISERIGEIPRASGAELLTVFPISFVTIHIALLGFVICLMLMPVFGRPRPIKRGVLTHFGDHLDAVATLMRRRGGEAFAKRRISDYMKRVRDETSGPWVLEEPAHPAVTPLPSPVADSARLDQTTPPTVSPISAETTPDHNLPNRSNDDSNQPD